MKRTNVLTIIVFILVLVCVLGCNKKDNEKETNDSTSSTTIIETHIHNFNDSLKYDSRNHYYECECGEIKDLEPHIFDAFVLDNYIQTKCIKCGYEKERKIITPIIDGLYFDGENYYILNEDGLYNFAGIINGEIVKADIFKKNMFSSTKVYLMNDCDLKNKDWTPIREEISYTYEEQYHKDSNLDGMIFDGLNHKISNMNIVGDKSLGFIGITGSSFTIKNIEFVNATVTSTSGWISIVCGYQSGNVNYSNIKIVNSNLGNKENSYKVGSIVGMCQLAFGSINIDGCTISSSVISGKYSVSGLVGEMTGSDRFNFTNNKVENTKIMSTNGEDVSNSISVWDKNFISMNRNQTDEFFRTDSRSNNNIIINVNFEYE